MQRSTFALLATLLSLGVSHAMGNDLPPDNAMSLSDMAKKLEDQGFVPITEMSLDGGVWEVETYNIAGEKIDMTVDPVTGQILTTKLDD